MKLSSLTQQDKIKLAAELDGYSKERQVEDTDFNIALQHDPSLQYATSYDAIIQLIQKQDLSTIIAIQCYVCRTLDCTLVATPSQLLDALLVATGKATL